MKKNRNADSHFYTASPFWGMWKGSRVAFLCTCRWWAHDAHPPTHLGADDDAVAYFSCFVGWTGITPLAPPFHHTDRMSHKSMKHIFIAHKCHHAMRHFRSSFSFTVSASVYFFGVCSALLIPLGELPCFQYINIWFQIEYVKWRIMSASLFLNIRIFKYLYSLRNERDVLAPSLPVFITLIHKMYVSIRFI